LNESKITGKLILKGVSSYYGFKVAEENKLRFFCIFEFFNLEIIFVREVKGKKCSN
jgi:hypothetical protein